MIYRPRLTPEWHLLFQCRCGEPVSVPSFGIATQACKCGRVYRYDCKHISLVHVPEKREGAA